MPTSAVGTFVLIEVRPEQAPEVVNLPDEVDLWDIFYEKIASTPEDVPYPPHLNRPGLRILSDELMVMRSTAYNRWGIAGPFLIVRLGEGGFVSLSPDDVQDILNDLLIDKKGLLHPACMIASPFRRHFDENTAPPAGYVPKSGRWAK